LIPFVVLGKIVVVSLKLGEEKVVSTTRGWDSQTGAHVQWGHRDTDLIFNDVVSRRVLEEEVLAFYY
jgi:hypothetical protein